MILIVATQRSGGTRWGLARSAPQEPDSRITPKDNAEFEEATNPMMAGRFKEAIQAWTPQIVANPYDARLAYSLAIIYMRLGQYKDGIFYAGLACTNDPTEVRYKWLLRSQTIMAGEPESSIPPECRLKVPAHPPAHVRFVDDTPKAGVENFALGRGAAWGDFDRDGYDDLLVCAERSPFRLFRNLGNGRFADVTREKGVVDPVGLGCYAVHFVDYDNDGYEDIFLTSNGWGGTNRLFLFHNEGGRRFADVTTKAGLDGPINAFGASWADYDNDGNVDLAVATGIALPDGDRPRLFHNRGDGVFSEVGIEAGLTRKATWSSVCWGDYDNNGLQDLFAAGFAQGCNLYHNLGEGRFKDVTRRAGIECPASNYTCEFLDYNNNGNADIFVSTYPAWGLEWSDLMSMVETHISGRPASFREQQLLLRNEGDGTFTQVSERAGIVGKHGGMASQVADVDNDGYPDIVIGTGNPQLDWTEPDALYLNDANGRFRNVAASAGLNNYGMLHGTAFSDYDHSGNLSFYGSYGGFYWGTRDRARLYRNTGSGKQALEIQLIGIRSNRDAIGSRVIARVDKRTIHQYLDGGAGFGSMNSRIVHLGLGAAHSVDSLEVLWASGAKQTFTDVRGGQRIKIVEGESKLETVFSFK